VARLRDVRAPVGVHRDLRVADAGGGGHRRRGVRRTRFSSPFVQPHMIRPLFPACRSRAPVTRACARVS